MENKSHALAAGVFVLAVAALLVALAMWLTRDVTSAVAYEMTTDSSVTGLQPQAAVRFKGVAIGKVTGISFDPDRRASVLVRIAVAADAPITRATFATLVPQGVTGLSFIQLDDPGGSAEPPAPGPNGRPPRIPLQGSALGQLPDRLTDLTGKLEHTADNLNLLLRGENQTALTSMLTEVTAAARSLNQLAAHANRALDAQLGPGGADLPALARQTAGTLKSLQDAGNKVSAAMDNVSSAAADLHQGISALTAQGGAIDRLSDSAAALNATTLPRIQNLTEDAGRAIRRFDRAVDAIHENPQSLIYGSGAVAPGPGEPGFAMPAAAQEGQQTQPAH